MRFAISILVCAIALPYAPAAAAAGPGSTQGKTSLEARAEAPAYRLSAEVDLPVLLISAAVSASWLLSPELEAPYCAPRCDPETLNFIDKPAAGLYSTAWQGASDVATASVLSTMPLLLALGEGPLHAMSDLVVVGQATLFASAVQVVTSFATSRPRPRLYGDEAPLDERDDGNAARSFFSGHSATCFAATISTFRTLQRVNRPELAWTALGLGLLGSTFVSVGRVAAGSHFPTDVAAGVAVGVASGLLLPALHSAPSDAARAALGSPVLARVVPVFDEGFGGASFIGTF